MSRHIFDTFREGHAVRLVIGWDRRLQEFFFQLEQPNAGREEMMLATSLTMNSSQLGEMEPILAELQKLGVAPPQKMVDEVRADKENNVGNRIEHYPAS